MRTVGIVEERTPADFTRALQVQSSYVESCLTHALVAALASVAWQRCPGRPLQIFNSEVDDAGFDLVVTYASHSRYIQLKQAHADKVPSKCSIRADFASRPGSCVVLMSHDLLTLELKSFRFFGAAPSQPMPDVSSLPKSKAPGRRNAAGTRKIRDNYRDVRITRFTAPLTIERLFDKLFPALVA